MHPTPEQIAAYTSAAVALLTAIAAFVNSIRNATKATDNHATVLAALEKKADKPVNWKVSP
jgi:hypothetical protein